MVLFWVLDRKVGSRPGVHRSCCMIGLMGWQPFQYEGNGMKWLGYMVKPLLNPNGPCAAEFFCCFCVFCWSLHFLLGDSLIQTSRHSNLPNKKSISKNLKRMGLELSNLHPRKTNMTMGSKTTNYQVIQFVNELDPRSLEVTNNHPEFGSRFHHPKKRHQQNCQVKMYFLSNVRWFSS